jgi:hypothetical protein
LIRETEYWIEEGAPSRGDDYTYFKVGEDIPLKKGDQMVIIPGPLGKGWKLRVLTTEQ